MRGRNSIFYSIDGVDFFSSSYWSVELLTEPSRDEKTGWPKTEQKDKGTSGGGKNDTRTSVQGNKGRDGNHPGLSNEDGKERHQLQKARKNNNIWTRSKKKRRGEGSRADEERWRSRWTALALTLQPVVQTPTKRCKKETKFGDWHNKRKTPSLSCIGAGTWWVQTWWECCYKTLLPLGCHPRGGPIEARMEGWRKRGPARVADYSQGSATSTVWVRLKLSEGSTSVLGPEGWEGSPTRVMHGPGGWTWIGGGRRRWKQVWCMAAT